MSRDEEIATYPPNSHDFLTPPVNTPLTYDSLFEVAFSNMFFYLQKGKFIDYLIVEHKMQEQEATSYYNRALELINKDSIKKYLKDEWTSRTDKTIWEKETKEGLDVNTHWCEGIANVFALLIQNAKDEEYYRKRGNGKFPSLDGKELTQIITSFEHLPPFFQKRKTNPLNQLIG